MLQFEVPGAWELPLAARYMALVRERERKRGRASPHAHSHPQSHTHKLQLERARARSALSLTHTCARMCCPSPPDTWRQDVLLAPGCVSRWRQRARRRSTSSFWLCLPLCPSKACQQIVSRSTSSFGSASLYVLNIYLYVDIQTDRRVVCTHIHA